MRSSALKWMKQVLLPCRQAGFRRERGVMYVQYVLKQSYSHSFDRCHSKGKLMIFSNRFCYHIYKQKKKYTGWAFKNEIIILLDISN